MLNDSDCTVPESDFMFVIIVDKFNLQFKQYFCSKKLGT